MTWPSSDIPTGNTDAPGDNPQAARNDILGLMQAFNLLRNHFSLFMRDLAQAADASEARTTLQVLSATRANQVPVNTSALTSGECFVTSAPLTLASGLAAGTTLMIYNDSAASIAITQGAGVTLRVAGTTLTGNRTLSGRGIVSVWVRSTSEYIISGAGLV